MADTTREPESVRAAIRSLVLLALLGGSVATAWVLSAHYGREARLGAEILDTLRKEGLTERWGDQPLEQWYLIRQAGRPTGWKRISRQPVENGYVGQISQWNISQNPAERYGVTWQLSNDMQRGHYDAQTFQLIVTPGGVRSHQSSETAIDLQAGRVEVLQQMGKGLFQSTGRAPENYIPEGTLELVLAEVARRKETAEFQMIIDSIPPHTPGGEPTFLTLTASWRGPAQTVPKGSRIVTTTGLRGQTFSQNVYIFDADGAIDQIITGTDGATRFIRASRQQVEEAFPRATSLIQNDTATP
jgi:hypothetical protein